MAQLILAGLESALPAYYRVKFNLSDLGIGLFYGAILLIYCIGTVIAGRRYRSMPDYTRKID